MRKAATYWLHQIIEMDVKDLPEECIHPFHSERDVHFFVISLYLLHILPQCAGMWRERETFLQLPEGV